MANLTLTSSNILKISGIVAAASFPTSALVHSATFYFWGLDFAVVGSVEDIIVGGFRMLLIWLFFGLLFSSLAIGGVIDAHIKSDPRYKRIEKRIIRYTQNVATIMIVVMVIEFLYLQLPRDRPVVYTLMAIAVIAVNSISLIFYRGSREAIIAGVQSSYRAYVAAAWLCATVVSITFGVMVTRQGVSLVNPRGDLPDLPFECMLSHSVWWVGSRGMVVQCAGRTYMILRSESDIALTADALY